MGRNIFLSYSHQDSRWVLRRLVPCLEAAGVEVLVDRERFGAGRAVIGQMDAAQDGASVTLAVLSPAYAASAMCQHELRRAIASDPGFEMGKLLPVVRAVEPPPELQGNRQPLYVDLTDDRRADAWDLLMRTLGISLGCEVPAWLLARDEIMSCLVNGQSLNLVVRGGANWRALLDSVSRDGNVLQGVVDLQNGATASRRGLVQEILRASGRPVSVPPEPEDLVTLSRAFDESVEQAKIAITHFDLVAHRRDRYELDLFAALRFLTSEEQRLCLLVQSRVPFVELLPPEHPLLSIANMRVVALHGRT